MHRRNHKTRKFRRRNAKRKLRYTKRRALRLRRNKRTQRGGMAASVVSKEGIVLQEYQDPPVEVSIGGMKAMVPYSTYVRDFKGKTEQELD